MTQHDTKWKLLIQLWRGSFSKNSTSDKRNKCFVGLKNKSFIPQQIASDMSDMVRVKPGGRPKSLFQKKSQMLSAYPGQAENSTWLTGSGLKNTVLRSGDLDKMVARISTKSLYRDSCDITREKRYFKVSVFCINYIYCIQYMDKNMCNRYYDLSACVKNAVTWFETLNSGFIPCYSLLTQPQHLEAYSLNTHTSFMDEF